MLLDKPLPRFLVRWLVCGLGLWIAAAFLSNSISYDSEPFVIIMSGLILAVINTFIKPVLVILSLPVIFLTVGLFAIVINGLTVFIASWLYGPLQIANFWSAVFAGMVIGLVNYLVTTILEDSTA